jgi:hypothetical protein
MLILFLDCDFYFSTLLWGFVHGVSLYLFRFVTPISRVSLGLCDICFDWGVFFLGAPFHLPLIV